MCIAFWCASPADPARREGWMAQYRFVLAANRDETLDRATAPSCWWRVAPKSSPGVKSLAAGGAGGELPDGGRGTGVAAGPGSGGSGELAAESGAASDEFILAGRDLVGGGTWLGISAGKSRRICCLTNVRIPGERFNKNAQSRGNLVLDFLTGGNEEEFEGAAKEGKRTCLPELHGGDDGVVAARAAGGEGLCEKCRTRLFVRAVSARRSNFNPYNLLMVSLADDADGARYPLEFYGAGTSASEECIAPDMPDGMVQSVTNGGFNEPWPKLERGKAAFARSLGVKHTRKQAYDQNQGQVSPSEAAQQEERDLVANLFRDLQDPWKPDRSDLEKTGVPPETEALLSSVFIPAIKLPSLTAAPGAEPSAVDYGTRSQVVLLVSHDGEVLFVERALMVDSSREENADQLPVSSEGPPGVVASARGPRLTERQEQDAEGRTWKVSEHRFRWA